MFNPLDLPGPEFLVFYAATALVVLGVLYVVRASDEGGRAPRLDTSDPYLIAYLRGGANEVLRVATVALIDRGLLSVNEDELTVKRRRSHVENLRLPLERDVVHFFARERPSKDIFDDGGLRAACEPYERRLTMLGLLPDDGRRADRRRRLAYALLVLVGLAVTKFVVALSRGRTNVFLLIVFTVVASIAAVKLATPFRTTRGNTMLADLRVLFGRLKGRAPRIQAGTGDANAALLAAVFGLRALPWPDFDYARRLYPRTASASGDGGGCGSSCGSGCGGGGCGGGCGGCSG